MRSLGLLTTVHGRLDHLAAQARWLQRSTRAPDEHVVVWMGGPDPRPVLDELAPDACVVALDVEGPLPLAAARNHAAGVAGTDVLVFLDVDCLPAPTTLERYAEATMPGAVLAGPVGYLPADLPPPATDPDRCGWPTLRRAGHHPEGRPRPGPGGPVAEERVELLWSLSMAVGASTFDHIGGFDEAYRGYGGEDTDFAFRMRAAGVELRWCPAADAVHLHHPVESPPVRHLDDIVANARRFHDRWGSWPMGGWLEGFARLGLVEWDEAGSHLATVPAHG